MCRIVGGINLNFEKFSQSNLSAMTNSLIKGGPDGGDTLILDNLGFGHRRLSIIDLSDSASQPMRQGKWVITYNGEIYNFKEIKNSLIKLGASFITSSDTEVILSAFEYWGKNAVKKFRGMFAFAIYNNETKVLTLCRDRFGVKPLYIYKKGNLFLFSSEIRAFHEHENFDKTLDLSGLPHYLQKGYFRSDSCIFKYVSKLKPGSFLDIHPNGNLEYSQYWSSKDYYKNTDTNSIKISTQEVEDQLKESFKLRLVADVEVGVFLSGGIDSSLIAALLQKESDKPLKTFTVGFKEEKYNEADIANEIATQLGTSHKEFICSEKDFLDTIDILPDIFDEPFGDSSAIPTYLVSKFASRDVKVVLSGDGGDELFGGYSKYIFALNAKYILMVPYVLRKILHNVLLLINPNFIESINKFIGFKRHVQLSNRFHKLRQVILSKNIDDFFDRSSNFLSNNDLEIFTGRKSSQNDIKVECYGNSKLSYFGLKDIYGYLPNDILTKVDRSSMYVGLEAREPFLDPDLFKHAIKLNDKIKFKKRVGGKYILRKILANYVSPSLLNRPKQGFTIPLEKWLNGNLKSQIVEIQDDFKFFKTFELDQDFYKKAVKSFYANKGEFNPYFIWFVFCLYKWNHKWITS